MRHLSYFLSFAFILFGIKLNAQTITFDGIKYSISAQQASVIDIETPKTMVEIPNSITYNDTTYPVVSITGFSTCGNTIESLTIPSNVTRLSGTNVLTSLKELYITDSPNSLWISNIYSYDGDSDRAEGRHAFYYSPLKTLYLGRNLQYFRDNSNGYSPFALHNFENVTIGPEVTVLYNNLFWNCTFESFNLEQAVSLREICDDAFSKTNLEEIILPESVESVSNDFRFNQKLKYLYIGKSLSKLDYSFEHFFSIDSITVNPENPNFSSISNTLYTADKQILLRHMPAAIISESTPAKKVGDHAFDELQQSTLNIPQGVETIGSNVSNNCPQLSSIVIPSSVKSISNKAFSSWSLNNTSESWYFDGDSRNYSADKGCFIVLANEPPTIGDDVFKGREDWTLWVPYSWYNKYLDRDGIYITGWDIFKDYIYGSQLISVVPNILEAGKVSSDKRFYNALESMSLTLDSLNQYYNFVGWFDRDQLISPEHKIMHKVVSLKPIEARFEPIPDAASDFVSVHIIDGHILIDIALTANAGTYTTTLYDDNDNKLGSVTTQISKTTSRSGFENELSDFSKATKYSLIVYDQNNQKQAHYIGKIKSNDSVLTIKNLNNYSKPTIYYNLQGQKVTTPLKGNLYIVNLDGKYRKIRY